MYRTTLVHALVMVMAIHAVYSLFIIAGNMCALLHIITNVLARTQR